MPDGSDHITYIEPAGHRYDVVCSCGWEADGFDDDDDAVDAGFEHRSSVED
jgi:hypothetical protein